MHGESIGCIRELVDASMSSVAGAEPQMSFLNSSEVSTFTKENMQNRESKGTPSILKFSCTMMRCLTDNQGGIDQM